ncbi:hypothetical protein HY449_00645 [Candidatus Pacearchaeota archaeon]|nr:hypothetical protein [Candidatus Pacearchaeota archaeon]
MKKIFKYAFIDAFWTSAYVIIVALLPYFLGQSALKDVKSIIIPIAMLMLLVFSVALVGSLIFGRPVIWYVDGKKKDAVSLLVCTLGILFIITLTVFLILTIFAGA